MTQAAVTLTSTCCGIRRPLLAALGVVSVALGAIGIFVPGLPTTVFLLIASYLFARSSPALERRLLTHPRLGAYLRAARNGTMPRRAKIVSITGMWGGIGASVAVLGASMLSGIVLLLGVVGTVAIGVFTRSA